MSTKKTPYEILGAARTDNFYQLRLAYQKKIHEYKQSRLNSSSGQRMTAEDFRLVCRAYETVSDTEKREKHDKTTEWTSYISLDQYTLQQLAAEPELISELKTRLRNATLREINAQDPLTGQTALYCAARCCNTEAVYYLTQEGAEPDLTQRTKSTALHAGAFFQHPEVIRCLLECGADCRVENSSNHTPEDESIGDGKDVFSKLKQSPFVQAAADQLQWLKSNFNATGYHIDKQYYRLGQTLLHCAAKKGYLDMVRWLVEDNSANLDIVDNNLNTALHLAAFRGYASVVEYLLSRGANSNLLNKWCMTAEQEGSVHDKKLTSIFLSMRNRDAFEMASQGVLWWFEYHFGKRSVNMTNEKGANLLYIACRCGETSIAAWLLAKGADVNKKLLMDSQSTPLHGAAFGGHVKTVELLLENGANTNIKNAYGTTPYHDTKSEEIKILLQKYKSNLEENKFFSVHLYGDGSKSGNAPLARLQLMCDATYNDLVNAMPASIKDKYPSFSVSRHPLNFEQPNTTVLSAVYRAQFGETRFIHFPLCLTAHERARYMNSGHVLRQEAPFVVRRDTLNSGFAGQKPATIDVRGQLDIQQTFRFGDLTFTFPINCAEEDAKISIQYSFTSNSGVHNLPNCLCLFKTNYENDNRKLKEMPTVTLNGEPNAQLYTWVSSTAYWFLNKTAKDRLVAVGETHAFVRHADVIPSKLSIRPDMYIPSADGTPLQLRTTPVECYCLKVREHNKKDFPHIAYHGTDIKAIESILMDGLVMPNTVVSCGLRICPPPNHIARGQKLFNIDDFSNGIFITPSIYYCSDPAYAVVFTHDDERLIAVLECSVKDGKFGAFKSTVPSYVAHPGDDLEKIEWRLTNPADLEIISILLIPVVKSKSKEVKIRAKKLGVDPNSFK